MTKAKATPEVKSEAKAAPAVAQQVEQQTEPKALVHSPAHLALPQQSHALVFTDEQKKLIKATVGSGLTDDQFAWGMYVAQRMNLDPLRRQVHFVKRRKKKARQANSTQDEWEEYLTIQVAIDGARAIANRGGCYAPSDQLPHYQYRDEELAGGKTKKVLFAVTVWVKKFTPVDRSWHEYGATAIFDEFVPLERDGNSWKVSSMWEKMPHNQLEKCAEFKALKRGFPEELDGLNIQEEFDRVDQEIQNEQHAADKRGEGDAPPSQTRKQRERGTLRQSKEPNRGHDQEGYTEGVVSGSGAPDPSAAKPKAKAKDEKPLEQLTVEVLKVNPCMKKLKADQVAENKKLKAAGKPEKYEPQAYFRLECKGDINITVFDKHCFQAALWSKGKTATFGITRNGSYINMGGVTEIAGDKFVVDPDTKDWIPEKKLKESQLPAQQQQPSQQQQDGELFHIQGEVVGFSDQNRKGEKMTTRTGQEMVMIDVLGLAQDRKADPNSIFVCIKQELFDALRLSEGERCAFTYQKRRETGGLFQIITDVEKVGDRRFQNGKPVESEREEEPEPEPSFEGAEPGDLWP